MENLEKLKLEIRCERELLAQWRKRGPVGKLHNIIIWIRRTPQRRDSFLDLTRDNTHLKRSYVKVNVDHAEESSSSLSFPPEEDSLTIPRS
jgi:hypothetical protein